MRNPRTIASKVGSAPNPASERSTSPIGSIAGPVATSAAKVEAMRLYATGTYDSIRAAAAWDPGSYRIQMRAAELQADRGYCRLAYHNAMRAAALFPHSAQAQRLARALATVDLAAADTAPVEALTAALTARGLAPEVFNGGGTGSLAWCCHEPALTEVTAGSGLLGGTLFDHYRSVHPEGALLFALGLLGVITRRNLLVMYMSLELMLNSANLALVSFSRFNDNHNGQVMVFFILTVAAAESAIGLAILVVLFRNLSTINVEDLDSLKG